MSEMENYESALDEAFGHFFDMAKKAGPGAAERFVADLGDDDKDALLAALLREKGAVTRRAFGEVPERTIEMRGLFYGSDEFYVLPVPRQQGEG